MDIFRTILRYFGILLLLAVLAALILIQIPSVQTSGIQRVIPLLEEKLNADIEIGAIHFKPINTLVVKDLIVKDRAPFNESVSDTILYVGSLSARFSLTSIMGDGHEGSVIKSASLDDVDFNIVIEGGEYRNNLRRILGKKDSEPSAGMPEKDIVSVRDVIGNNVRFTLRNLISAPKETDGKSINWKDLDVRNASFRASDFSISHGKFTFQLDRINFEEKCGWKVQDITGYASIGKGDTEITNLMIDDGDSKATIDFRMLGKKMMFRDFVHKVMMKADFKDGYFSFSTLSRLIPALKPGPSSVLITGKAYGRITSLHFDDLKIVSRNGLVDAKINGSVVGLPDINKTSFNIKVNDTRFRMRDLGNFIRSVTHTRNNLSRFGKGMDYRADISAHGTLKEMHVTARLLQGNDNGLIKADVTARNLSGKKSKPVILNGWLNTSLFDLESLLGSSSVNDISLSTRFSASLPAGSTPLIAKVDSMRIDNVLFKGHSYKNITGYAGIENRDIAAELTSKDEPLDADIRLWTDKTQYNATVIINNADLKTLNFLHNETALAKMTVYAHVGKDFSHLNGNASLSGIELTGDDGPQQISDITLHADRQDGEYNIAMDSHLAILRFNGSPRAFQGHFSTGDMTDLFSFIKPGLYLEDGSSISIKKDSTGYITGNIFSERVAYNLNYIKDVTLDFKGYANDFQADISSPNIMLGGYNLDNDRIAVTRIDSLYRLDYSFKNSKGAFEDGLISAELVKSGKDNMDFRINPSNFSLDGQKWEIASTGINIRGSKAAIDSLTVNCGQQAIEVNGIISKDSPESLHLTVRDLDLKPLNYAMRSMGKNMAIDGSLNAGATLISPFGDDIPDIEAYLEADSLEVAGYSLGSLSVKSVYDKGKKAIVATAEEKIDGLRKLAAEAEYYHSDKSVNVKVSVDRFPFGFVRNLMPSLFNRLEGTLSGKYSVSGPISKPSLASNDARIDDGIFEMAFTHVPYGISGTFHVDDYGLHLDDMPITDFKKGIGRTSGGIKWNHLKDIVMDIHANVTDIQGLGIPAGTEGMFYGNVYASGVVSLTGPFKNMVLGADCRTTLDSDLHFTISRLSNASKSDLLTFVDPSFKPVDKYQSIVEKYSEKKKKSGGNFAMKMHVVPTTALDLFFDIGGGGFAAGGNGTGSGSLDLNIPAKGQFSMLGDYTLQEGIFGMNINNLIRKNFQITNGSSIKFGGDLMKSTVNLNATYETKASIASLISDTTSVSNRRTVLCGIGITNSISNPSIKFSINIPDLDPSIRPNVENALSTDDKVQKQFLSLLLSGNFLPDEQSGIVNNNSLIYSNVSEIMANQVNNIFNRLDIPLDLGLNYQPSDKGTNIFDVALSTQLWNNRVIIGGTFGNRQRTTSSKQSFFGDVDIQYKVTRSGAFRIKAFSHAADQYSNGASAFLDNSQRNGIGLTWQQEFDSFGKWVRNLFSNKQKRDENAIMDVLKKETKTIEINE